MRFNVVSRAPVVDVPLSGDAHAVTLASSDANDKGLYFVLPVLLLDCKAAKNDRAAMATKEISTGNPLKVGTRSDDRK